MKFRHNVHRNYANETDRDISNDFRPTQHLNHRFVYASDTSAIYKPISASGTLVPSSICILAIVFLLSVFTWQNKRDLLLQRVLRTDLCICLYDFYISILQIGFLLLMLIIIQRNLALYISKRFSKEHIFNYFFTKSTIFNYITFLSSVATRQ